MAFPLLPQERVIKAPNGLDELVSEINREHVAGDFVATRLYGQHGQTLLRARVGGVAVTVGVYHELPKILSIIGEDSVALRMIDPEHLVSYGQALKRWQGEIVTGLGRPPAVPLKSTAQVLRDLSGDDRTRQVYMTAEPAAGWNELYAIFPGGEERFLALLDDSFSSAVIQKEPSEERLALLTEAVVLAVQGRGYRLL
jgi:hypothetical protein